jgi:hypothetical protein
LVHIGVLTMVVIAAKFTGKCKRCGKLIRPGKPMDWTKEGGATHVTKEGCEQAETTLTLRPAQPEDPQDRARVVELLLSHPWKAATSKQYEKLPHEYSLRKFWNEGDFVWTLEYIRRVGYEAMLLGRIWIYYSISDRVYWDCGGSTEVCGLINRAVRRSEPRPLGSQVV